MMRGIFLIFLLLLFSPGTASAHSFQKDGSIGATLHIDPNDEPRSGVRAVLHFEFSDTQNLFAIEKCQCTLLIQQNNAEVYSAQLQGSAAITAGVPYTFDASGEYALRIIGIPQSPGGFSAFSLNFPVVVGQGEVPLTSYGWFWPVVGGFGVLALALPVWLLMRPTSDEKRKRNNS